MKDEVSDPSALISLRGIPGADVLGISTVPL